ncbi:AMP-binding protein [Phenylobacterium sp.]|uniref:AMP-dependent synthetase/ligase n=1 Tax=Phenylobacterium sp. TaxID=1871053 RepID=UPI0025D9A611|nr:AMP-binding protein [Phenylobacterium sp.]
MDTSTTAVAADGDAGSAANVAQVFQALALAGGDGLVFRRRRAGGWQDLSWSAFAAEVGEIGAANLAFGLGAGDVVCVLARTRPEWLAADLGAVTCGMVCAGIYPTEPADKVAYVLNDCGARVVFVDDAEQVEKLKAARGKCPKVEAVVVIESTAMPPGDPWFISLAEWRRAGRELIKTRPAVLATAAASAGPTTPAILIYTSGTTGPPKGAIITHGNIAYQLAHAPAVIGLQAGWRRPSFLPLCHVAERLFTYMAMAGGMISCFVDGPTELLAAMPELRPHFMLAVPRVYEKLHAQATAWLAAQPEDVQAEIRQAERRALEAVQLDAAGQLSEAAAAAWRQDQDGPLRTLRAAIGLDRVAMLMSGGARFPVALGQWLHAIGARVDDIYGMTECGTIALNQDHRTTPGLVGRPFSHGEVTLGAEGEILVRGPHVFAGYLNLPDKTADAFQGDWFRTGDVGRFDEAGRLVLLDRIKDIIISSSGKNITPSEVEGALKAASPLIADAVAVGDGRNYVTALIMIDAALAQQTLAARGEQYESFAQLAAAESTRTLVAEAVEEANRHLSRAEGVKAFRIIPRQLSPTDEAMTPTLKLKRRVLIDTYSDLVEDMYPAFRKA